MDKVLKIRIMIMAMLMAAGLAQAASFRPLPEQERANLGATHVATFTYADFTETTTNTAETFTNLFAVAAKEGVELVAMQLITAFDTGNTNYTGSLAVTVGDGDDADLYLTSTELASDGTEVWLKYGRSVQAATSGTLSYWHPTNAITATVTAGTITFTNYYNPVNWTATLTNDNNVLAVTNVTWSTQVISGYTNATVAAVTITNTQTILTALTDDSTGRKVYTAADKVEFVFTPNAEESTSEFTSGEVRFYFKWVQ